MEDKIVYKILSFTNNIAIDICLVEYDSVFKDKFYCNLQNKGS